MVKRRDKPIRWRTVLVWVLVAVIVLSAVYYATGDWKLVVGIPVIMIVGYVFLCLTLLVSRLFPLMLIGVVVWLCRMLLPKRFRKSAMEEPVHPLMFVPVGAVILGGIFYLMYLLYGDARLVFEGVLGAVYFLGFMSGLVWVISRAVNGWRRLARSRDVGRASPNDGSELP